MDPERTIAHALSEWASLSPDKIAFTFLRESDGEVSLTYGELEARVRSLAAHLGKRVGAGERALLLCPPGLDFIIGFMACLAAGVIAVPCNIPKPRQLAWRRLAAIVSDAEARVVLTVGETERDFRRWIDAEPALRDLPLIAVDEHRTDRDAADGPPPGEVAFLQYTSGSTGNAKGVIVTHANLMHNEALIREAFGHDRDTVIVTWLPLFHDLGLIGNVLQTIYLGATCHLMAPSSFMQSPMRWLRAISKTRAVTAMAPNFAYDRCAHVATEDDLRELDLSSWQVALNGAEPIRASTIRAFERVFGRCGYSPSASFPAYGLAEATLIVATSDRALGADIASADLAAMRGGRWQSPAAGAPSAELVSSGRVRGGMTLLAVDPETHEVVADGQVGELWVQGESVAQGYWRRPDLTAEIFGATTKDGQGPFLRTGDLVLLLGGRLFVVGRSKELIIIRGQNVYPQDVEHVVQEACPELRKDSGAAFSVEVDGEESLFLVHEVERTSLRNLDGDSIVRAARRAVSEAFEIELRGIVLIRPAALPKTSSGKIQRTLCKSLYAEGALDEVYASVHQHAIEADSDVEAAPPLDDVDAVADWIAGRTAAYLGMDREEIDTQAILAEYGLDSSMAVALAAEIAELVGAENDPGLVWTYPTVQALADFAHETARATRVAALV
jgi:acyl-CoA synthetase (AMP-forming)/AMP-acid ligase II/acyl carrier protein